MQISTWLGIEAARPLFTSGCEDDEKQKMLRVSGKAWRVIRDVAAERGAPEQRARERAERERARAAWEKEEAERLAARRAEIEEAERLEGEWRERDRAEESARRTQRLSAAVAPEIAACERNGNASRPLVRKGV